MPKSKGSGGAKKANSSRTRTIRGGQHEDGSIPRRSGKGKKGKPMPRTGGGDDDQRSDRSSDSGTLVGSGSSSSASTVVTQTAEKRMEMAAQKLQAIRLELSLASSTRIGDLAKRLAKPSKKSTVKQFRLLPQNIMGEWMVKRVVSPFEFYLEFMHDQTVGDGALAETNYHWWWPHMQKFYDNPVKRKALKANQDDLHVGQCFVIQEPEALKLNQLNWHRVRILNLDPPRKQALLFYCDTGRRDMVSCSRLLKLHPKFAKYEAHLFRCYLYNVLPATFGKTLLEWSMGAVAHFKDVMSRWEGRRIYGLVLARSRTAIERGIPGNCQNLGIVLFNMGGGKDREPSCTVNALLVKSGHATATGLFSTCPHQLGRPGRGEGKDFNEIDFRREHPHLSQKQEKSPPKAVHLYAPPTKPELDWLPTTAKERLAHVNINYSKGLNYIMMHIVRESKVLMEMQDAIALTLRGTRPLTELQPGQFVAYQVQVGKETPPMSHTCHRGLILSTTEEPDFYKVLAVDYGKETVVLKRRIFKLEDYFLGIPSFAIRAHLAVPGLVPGKSRSRWSAEANDRFVKYLLSWEPTKYFVFRPIGSKWIKLDSLRQEVVFDTKTKKWKAGRRPTCGNDGDLDLKKYPLLKSLHRSVGVHIKYEAKKKESSSVWQFADLHARLKRKNVITLDKKAKTRTDTRIRRDMLDGWEVDVLTQANIKSKR